MIISREITVTITHHIRGIDIVPVNTIEKVWEALFARTQIIVHPI